MRPGGSTGAPVEALVDAFAAPLVRYARRRGCSWADAEDAVAETFTVAWRRRAELPEGSEALPWLYGVLRNVLRNQARGDQRRQRLARRAGGLRVVDAPPADGRLDAPPVLDALAALGDDDRELLLLLAWERLSHAEAAVVLGLSVNAVALRASRARRRLAGALQVLERQDEAPAGHETGEGSE